jgi:hypothetical protein
MDVSPTSGRVLAGSQEVKKGFGEIIKIGKERGPLVSAPEKKMKKRFYPALTH